MKLKEYKVYKHINKLNNKIYIGITRQDIQRRWRNYGKGYINSVFFYNAIQKYGWDNFEHIVLFDRLTQKEAEEIEVELISYHKSNNKQFGYNIQNGGSHFGFHSEETKLKMRQNHANFKGKNHPQYDTGKSIICLETKEIFPSISNAARKFNVNKSSIMRVCQHKQYTSNGLHFLYLEEYDSNQKYDLPIKNRSKKVICIENGHIFNSVSECEKQLQLNNVSAVCKHKIPSAKGLHFCYYEDYVENNF